MAATAVLLLALAGCGAGEEPAAAAAAVVTDLRARALDTVEVAPADAAAQLLDYAERTYPQHFPGHPETQAQAPFVYRHYVETGTYLGVVVQADPVYHRLGVYVMGGPFGDRPEHVGPLTGYIQPVPPTR